MISRIVIWIVFAAGWALGILGLAYFGLQDPSNAILDKWWLSFIAASILVALVPLLASILAVINRRALAGTVYLLAAPVFARWALLNADAPWFSHTYSGFSLICFIFGLCWMFAWWRNWPPLLTRPLGLRRRILLWCLAIFATGTLDIAVTFVLEALPFEWSADCSPSAVFSRSTFGQDTLFTAHMIRVGHQLKAANAWIGSWAIARVEERFWGWRFPRVVLVSAGFGLRSDSDYLIDGRRSIGIVSRFLPIVEVRPCSRISRLADAGVELRLLRSGFPKNDARIMGRVIRWKDLGPHEPWVLREYELVKGVQVEIIGPKGTFIASTDSEGIYDVPGLPPGKYKADVLNGDSHYPRTTAFHQDSSDLTVGQVAVYSFSVE